MPDSVNTLKKLPDEYVCPIMSFWSYRLCIYIAIIKLYEVNQYISYNFIRLFMMKVEHKFPNHIYRKAISQYIGELSRYQ